MKWKLKVLKILDSIENENGTGYYKVKFQQTWLPSSVLQCFTQLIDDYWEEKKAATKEIVTKEETTVINDSENRSELSDNEAKKGCFFCGDVMEFKNLNAHERKHMKEQEVNFLSNCLDKHVDEKGLFIYMHENFQRQFHGGRDADLYCDEEMVVVQPADVVPPFPNASVPDVPFSRNVEQNSHPTKLHCPKCNINFRNFFDFRCHYHNDHKVTSDCFECDHCHRKFNSKELYERHQELHTAASRRLKSYGDKIKSVSKDVTSQQNKQRARKYEEFSPDVLNSARQYIKSVSLRRKKNTQERQKQLIFEMTDVCHPRIDGIGVDVELSKSEDAVPNISIVSGRQAYSCKVCGKTFFNKFHHREHFNVHSGEMPYICEFCSKRFAQRSGWNRHIKLHHKYKMFTGPLPRGAEKSMILKSPKDLPNIEEALTVVQDEQLSPDSSIGGGDQLTLQLSDGQSTMANHPPQYLPISPSKATPVSGDVAMLPLSSDKNKDSCAKNMKQIVFQCKKVRSMYGSLVFMIRVAHSCQWKYESREFAYILDDSGQVKSRIFVDDYPGGDWLDFPLDETANDVLLARIRRYDSYSRRGPKPTNPLKKRINSNQSVVPENTQVSDSSIPENIQQMSDSANSNHTIPTESIEEKIEKSHHKKNNEFLRVPKSSQGRIFRSGKEKRFQCQVCSRKFLAQAHLNDHMRIHTGEHPYKCMFCARPFRHKSGLNSHHKRHIQRGVFNRPISSMPLLNNKTAETSRQIETDDTSVQSRPTEEIQNAEVLSPPGLENLNMKSKRKGRTPKQHIKTALQQSVDFNEPLKIKVENDITSSQVTDNGSDNRSVSSDYDCNFCGMKFQIRTIYLKHLNAVHKSSKGMNQDQPAPFSFESGDESTKEEDMKFDPLFADVKIKEECIDEDY